MIVAWSGSKLTDILKSYVGLSGIIQNALESNPLSRDVFTFINKSQIKIYVTNQY